MKSILTDLLICPACLPQENRLLCHIEEIAGDDILSGSLHCDQCGTRFPIQDGIAVLLPTIHRDNQKAPSKYEDAFVVSSYLWSHYGDFLEDADATAAYREWADLMNEDSGFSLDAGCATGRFTFEMSEKCDFAVGIDNSRSFIRKTRQFMIEGKLDFSIPEEGRLMEQRTIRFPETWQRNKVEFIVGDAQAVPFRSGFFSSVSSLNLVDKVPLPLVHLKEMNRIAKERNSQFLLSDPFSWSSEIASELDWLGGTTNGSYPGRGMDNIVSLLMGEKRLVWPPWKIEKQGHVCWKIRNHRNHFELIRSCFVKASR
jgi:uncharacterized protein YbaR (Trm112 family)